MPWSVMHKRSSRISLKRNSVAHLLSDNSQRLLPFPGGNLYFYIKKAKKIKYSSEYGVYCVPLHIIYNKGFI